MEKDNGEKDENIFEKALKLFLNQKGVIYDSGSSLYIISEHKTFYIVFLKNIDILKLHRRKSNDYKSPVILLYAAIDKNKRFYDSVSNETKNLLYGNPTFGNIEQAIFYGEIICKDKREPRNVINVLSKTFMTELKNLIEDIEFLKVDYSLFREPFYNTYIHFYDLPYDKTISVENTDPKNNTNLNDLIIQTYQLEEKLDSNLPKEFYQSILAINSLPALYKFSSIVKANELFELSERIYCYLNEINYDDRSHRVQYEHFRAPVPFVLQELIDAIEEIKSALGWTNDSEGKRIECLLIDNKTDKFDDTQNPTICGALQSFGLSRLFKVRMLNGRLPDERAYQSEEEIFDADKFLKNDYQEKVYEKVKSYHFILLDFFLNGNNTYLATDFINEISRLKTVKGDYFTSWYFITSAVYDSVVKYSQSGLLAEYYELAVVNSGDDPTNEKRQIIFVYKLLTFINARIKTFRTYKNAIENMMLNETSEGEKARCCVKDKGKDFKAQYKNTANCFKECKQINCLGKIQTYIKRYRTEYDNIWSLFYEDRHEKVQKEIVELLDDTITKFIWLPEADWRMIQYQIDFINTKLKSITKDEQTNTYRQFSCDFIRDKITERSNIY